MAKASSDRSPLTRSGARRLGDDFQDQIALEVLVDWLEHSDRYQWVEVEADDSGALDDVVALTRNGGRLVRQVKFSTNPDSTADRLTWEMLLKQETGKTGKKATSWLQKWANTLLHLLPSTTPIDAALDTNRQPADEIRTILQLTGLIDFDQIPAATRAEITTQLDTEERARTFFANFRFNLNRPSLADLEEGLLRRFLARGGTELGWRSLKEEVGRWVCFRDEPSPGGRITLAEVKRAARWYQLQSLPQAFEVPSDYVLPSQDFHDQVLERLSAASKAGCGMLCASPGSGKSTYASRFYRDLVERDVPVVRHHYFLSLNDSNLYMRLEHQRAAESLMHDLERDHAQALGQLANDNPNSKNLRQWLEAVGSHYSMENNRLIVIVDGLDHVWREKRSVEELDRLLGMLLPVPEGVYILFVSQPVDDSQLPAKLLRAVPREQWQWLPPLSLSATTAWLNHHILELPSGGEPFREDDPRIDGLAEALHRRSNGHPLHLRYTLRAIQEQGLPLTAETIVSLPECPHEGITAYYEDLWRDLSVESQYVLQFFAATNFAWPRNGLRECLDPEGRNIPGTSKAIKQVEHLLRENELGLRPFHGSILAFVREQSDYGEIANELGQRALAWLTSKAPEYLRWSHAWILAADLGNEEPLLRGPDRAWTIDAIAQCRPESTVTSILARAIRIAVHRQELPRAIELSLLYGYYSESLEGGHSAPLYLLFTTLRINTSLEVRAVLRSRLRALADSEIVLLAEADKNAGVQEHGGRYAKVLADRIWGERHKDPMHRNSPSDIDPLLAVAASRGNRCSDRILDLVKANRENGHATHIVEAYAEELSVLRDSEALRSILRQLATTESATSEDSLNLIGDERPVALRRLLLLALEEGINCDTFATEIPAEPLAQIYAAVRKLKTFVPIDMKFPSLDLLNLSEHDLRERQTEVVQFFVQSFNCLLANYLWNNQSKSKSWLDEVGQCSWQREFVQLLNRLASTIAARILAGQAVSIGLLNAQLTTLTKPRFEGTDQAEFLYGVCAGRAVTELSLFTPILAAASGGSRTLAKAEFEQFFSTGYSTREYWIERYLAQRRQVLTTEALDWLLDITEEELNTSLGYFTERANLYAYLAAVAALHGSFERARQLAHAAASNLLSYGYHKDMLFYDVIGSIRSYHESNQDVPLVANESKRWLRQLAVPVTFVGEYTDGDETRYFTQELASAFGAMSPTLLIAYHLWQRTLEEYYDAEYSFQEILRVVDLTDPIFQAVARTASDWASIRALNDRLSTGVSGAFDAVEYLNRTLGPREAVAISSRQSPDSILNERSTGTVVPEPKDFPPERFSDYLEALHDSTLYSRETGAESWLTYWGNQGQLERAYKAVKSATDQRISRWDWIYSFAVQVTGRDEGYEWLVRTTRDGHGWSRYSENDATAERRWHLIKEHHPRWYDFLRDTTLSDDPRFGRFISHSSFGRIVKYLLFMGQHQLAKQIIDTMVKCALELVSSLTFPTPEWLTAEEGSNES